MIFLKIVKILLLILLVILFNKQIFAKECKFENNIKIGLIKNDYINYQYYLSYMIDKYSLKNSINFDLMEVDANIDEFDIIFGEYKDLKKLSLRDIQLPTKLESYYQENNIIIDNNILPLDLDTFILLTKNNLEKSSFEQLSNYYDLTKYTLGMRFNEQHDFINFLFYNLDQKGIDINSLSFEKFIGSFNKLYKNLNKTILKADYDGIYNSFEVSENIYTLFSDGILLYKDIEYSNFQLFPKSKYIWDEHKGVYISNLEFKPISFYGFSAYINNINNIDFVCYLTSKEARFKAFRDFNIQISPLSNKEIKLTGIKIPKKYQNILNEKYKFITKPNYEIDNKNLKLINEVVTNNNDLIEYINTNNYLN